MRPSLPSTFGPDGGVTVTITGFVAAATAAATASSSTAGLPAEPCILQLHGICISCTDARQIPGSGVATAAVFREVGLTGSGVTHQHIQNRLEFHGEVRPVPAWLRRRCEGIRQWPGHHRREV